MTTTTNRRVRVAVLAGTAAVVALVVAVGALEPRAPDGDTRAAAFLDGPMRFLTAVLPAAPAAAPYREILILGLRN